MCSETYIILQSLVASWATKKTVHIGIIDDFVI